MVSPGTSGVSRSAGAEDYPGRPRGEDHPGGSQGVCGAWQGLGGVKPCGATPSGHHWGYTNSLDG